MMNCIMERNFNPPISGAVGVDKGGGGLEENSDPTKIGCHFIKF